MYARDRGRVIPFLRLVGSRSKRFEYTPNLAIIDLGQGGLRTVIRPNHNGKWTDAEDDRLRDMAQYGALLPVIASTLGRSQEAVRSRANKLKIPVRSTERPQRVGYVDADSIAQALG